jgi:hypothetical protein
MTHHIQLQFSTPEPYPVEDRYAFRLRVEVVDAVDMPFEIFLHHKLVKNAEQGLVADNFLGICSAWELSLFPALAPADGQNPPFYRLAYVDFVLPGIEYVARVIEYLETERDNLCLFLDHLDQLSVVSLSWGPTTPVDDPSTTTTTMP